MHPCRLTLVLLVAATFPLHAAQEPPAESGMKKSSGGVWQSVLGGVKTVVGGAGSVAKTASGAVGKVFDFSGSKKNTGFRLDLVFSPNPVRLSQNASLTVRVQLFNTGKKTQLLEFSNAHRVEVVLRDSVGKIASRASVSSGAEAGMLTINPGERIEFWLQLPTRQLQAGVYTLEAAMAGQEGLVSKVPLKVAS